MSLVVIEGIDGAGKSTQIGLLQDKLSTGSKKSQTVHYPRTDSKWFGALISRFLRGEYGKLEEVDPYLVAMLYAGDRHAMKDQLINWVSEGIHVLADRYVYSNIAYQSAKLKEKERADLLRWIHELEYAHFRIPQPDISIFLDVPFCFTKKMLEEKRSGRSRAYLQGQKDIHETDLPFQQEVRRVYLELAENETDLVVLNCADTRGKIKAPEEIHEQICEILKTAKIVV